MSSIPRDELIDALHDLADELGKTPTRNEMNEHGRYSSRPYYTEFDSWNVALQAAGLDPNFEYVTSDVLLEDLQRVADDLDHPPRIDDYDEHGNHHWSTVMDRFDSWEDALLEADLDPSERPYEKRISDEDLIEDLRRVTMELGRPPTANEIDEFGEYSRGAFVRAFDSWSGALSAAGVQ